MFAGLISANLPDGSGVLTAIGDFTSILFPFYTQIGRGIRVREVPLEHIADAVTSPVPPWSRSPQCSPPTGGSPISMPCTPPAAPRVARLSLAAWEESSGRSGPEAQVGS